MLGKKICELRKKKGFTQEEVGLLLDISDKAVSKWENDLTKPSMKNLQKLSKIFDVSLDELVNIEEKNNNKKVFKIVLTGGPCAGKSTAKSWILNYFSKKGYKVLFIDESATEIINSGFNVGDVRDYNDFQKILFDYQLAREKIYEDISKVLPEDKLLIVCDRGILDQKAYMSKKDFKKILKIRKTNEVELRDSYDAVFHLVSAAKGCEEYYNYDNQARYETKEEAARVDDLLIDSWTGHPHLRIIDNSCDFDLKMKKLIKEISIFLGEPEPYEIERKFLIEKPNLDYLESLNNCSKVEIVQTYLMSFNDSEVRVRQRGIDGNYTYTKTEKISINPLKRIEKEKRITQDEYVCELLNADYSKGQIIKTRYCLVYRNQYFEIDVYPFFKDYAILEIELASEDENINIPKYINVLEEVTGKIEYNNSEIAKKIKI